MWYVTSQLGVQGRENRTYVSYACSKVATKWSTLKQSEKPVNKNQTKLRNTTYLLTLSVRLSFPFIFNLSPAKETPECILPPTCELIYQYKYNILYVSLNENEKALYCTQANKNGILLHLCLSYANNRKDILLHSDLNYTIFTAPMKITRCYNHYDTELDFQ